MKRHLYIIILVLCMVFTMIGLISVQAISIPDKESKTTAMVNILSSKKITSSTTGGEENVKGNMWIQTKNSDFNKGNNLGTTITKKGDGEIQLVKNKGLYSSGGIYTSEIIKTAPFQYLVISWNADTPRGTSIKIQGQARIKGQWSSWLSWGIWSSSMERNSASDSDTDTDTDTKDNLAKVDTDTFTVNGSSGKIGDAFRYRITLLTKDSKVTPAVRLVAATFNNSINGQKIQKVYNDELTNEQLNKLNKTINVPCYSQVIRNPQFAGDICSPTSIAMLLKFRGIDILPEQSAMGVYDSVYDGYGNWPFNTAYAGNYGFTSYVEYMNSINDLKREIIKGNPVAVSVKYRNNESVNKLYPVIHGAPISSTGGHIIVVCGFTKGQNGKDYIVVNDPAAPKDGEVRRKYLVNEFDAAWATSNRITYIVHNRVPGDGMVLPKILKASFKATGKTKNISGKAYEEYQLICDGNTIDLNKAVDRINPNYQEGISIMFSKDGGKYEYITPTNDKTLWFNKAKPKGKYNFLIFKKTGDSYSATLNYSNN